MLIKLKCVCGFCKSMRVYHLQILSCSLAAYALQYSSAAVYMFVYNFVSLNELDKPSHIYIYIYMYHAAAHLSDT